MSDDGSSTLDPRRRNVFTADNSLLEFVGSYADGLEKGLRSVDVGNLSRAIEEISAAASRGAHIYSIGNGGSAAIANHLCCDLTKGTFANGHPSIMAQSMSSNVSLITAIANDFNFENIFELQIEYYGQSNDVLIAVSSSGNSRNIINAVSAARAKGLLTIGLSGFSGGKLAEIADISLHVDVSNYGIVEDCHQAIFHIIAQVIARRRDGEIGW